MDLKPGSRWKSAVCDTEVVVVKPPKTPVRIECGGREMLPHGAERPSGQMLADGFADGVLLGKRYGDESCGLELLCTKGGAGSLAVDGRKLAVIEAKKLPSSD